MQLDQYQEAFVMHPVAKAMCTVLSAVAGSGKTTCSVMKIKKLIDDGYAEADDILFITFSNKSARDLTKKYKKLTGYDSQPFMSTIHSFCLHILRKYANTKVTLLSEWNSTLVMRDALVNLGFDKKYECDNKRDLTILARGAADVTHWYKSLMLARDTIRESTLEGFNFKDFDRYPDTDLSPSDFNKAYLEYERLKENVGQMDYSDLVYSLLVMLDSDPTLLNKVRESFPVIFVDECQDLDRLLYEFIFLISKGNTLFLIGDKAQTIYGFRWAAPYHMERDHLLHRFPTVHEFALRYNYRSTANIVKVTNITRSILRDRIESIPFREDTKGSVKIQKVASNKAEGQQVVNLIKSLVDQGYAYSDIAVLSRTNNYLKTIIEPMLAKDAIPYQLQTKNRKKFFDKPLVQAYFNFISVIVNPDNRLLLVDLAGHVKGVGEATVSKFRRVSYSGKSIFDMSWSPGENKKVIQIQNLHSTLTQLAEYQQPDSLVFILRAFEKCVLEYFPSGFATVKEMELIHKSLSTMVFTYYNEFGITNLQEIFDRVLLDFTDIDTTTDKNSVFMGTVHGSKGLEFPVTIVGDHSRWSVVDEDSFDEGCILHVALSRAIDKLIILHSDKYIDAAFKERDSQYTSVYLSFRNAAGY